MKKLASIATPQCLALVCSIALSLWVWLGGSSINTDAVIYLETARAFDAHGFATAIQVYNWPFYSILIAWIAHLGLSLEAAAQLLNLIFFAVVAQGFVWACEQLYPHDKRIHYFSALVILLLPRINILRGEIFRDNGYIAGIMLSLIALLRFTQSRSALAFMCWLLATGLATLFRPEAALIFFAGMFVLVTASAHKKSHAIVYILALLLAAAGILILAEILLGNEHRSLLFWWHYYTTDFRNDFAEKSAIVAKSVLGEFSDDYGNEGLVAVIVTVFVGITINTLNPVHALMLWLGRKYDTALSFSQRTILWAYAVALTLPPVIFIFKYRFLSARYLLGLALILLLLVPPRFFYLLRITHPKWLRASIATILILYFSITNIRQLHSETELKDAGIWLASQPGSVWTNNLPISYYARERDVARSVEVQHNSNWQNQLKTAGKFDWVALVIRKSEKDRISDYIDQIGGKEMKRFNGGGRLVVIVNTTKNNANAQ